MSRPKSMTDEEWKAKRSAARAANREKVTAQERAKYAAQPERRRAQARAYQRTHVEQERLRHHTYYAAHREQARAYYAAHRDNCLAKGRAYSVTHREQIRLWARAHQHAHPEIFQAKRQRRRARKRALPHDLTVTQWQTIKAHYRHCCAYCGKKQKRLTQDHLTPLSKGGGTTRHNIVPACRSCNSKKGTRDVLKPVQPLLL